MTAMNNDDLKSAQEYFLKSLRCNVNYYMARLYSGHCFQDLEDYKAALNEYLLVDQGALSADYPLWRVVKLKEQIGFCYFKVGNKQEARLQFQNVLEYYRNHPVDELAAIDEIYQSLPKSDAIHSELFKLESQ